MDAYERLKELNVEILEHTPKGGIYTSVRTFGENMVYVSGTGPACKSRKGKLGKLGRDLSLEEGIEEARYAMLNIISNLHHDIGNLNRIKRFVKTLVLVASDDAFYQQPLVANGASKLLLDVFGEEVGLPARSAIGVNVLPGNIPVEIELLLELEADQKCTQQGYV